MKSHRPGRRLAPILSIAVVGLMVLAGCGSGGSDESSSSDGTAPVGSEADVEAMIANIYGPGVTEADIEPEIVGGLKVAAAQPSQELLDKVASCLGKSVCETGQGELTIAIPLDDSSNTVALQDQASALLQALRYPNVKRVVMPNGKGDLATIIANFRSLISQRVDIIMYNTGYGSSLGKLAQQAIDADIILAIKDQPIPGIEPGPNTIFLGTENCGFGEGQAKSVIGDNESGSGVVAFVTGVPGNPFAAEWMPCARDVVEREGWSVASDGNTTDWTPQGEAEAASALLASGNDLDGITYDGSCDVLATTYLEADRTPPTMVSTGIGPNCAKVWASASGGEHAFDVWVGTGHTWFAPMLITMAIDRKTGAASSEESNFVLDLPFTAMDSVVKSNPDYASLPAAASFHTALPAELLDALFEG